MNFSKVTPLFRKILLSLFLAGYLSGLVNAAEDEDKKHIGDRVFVFDASRKIWAEEGQNHLPDGNVLSPERTCLYQDDNWYNWYYQEDKEGKEILELKPNALFWRNVKDKNHVYGVFENTESRLQALGGVLPKPTAAPRAGELRLVGQRRFTYREHTWLDNDLKDAYRLLSNYSCVHGDATWRMWYKDQLLSPILELGPNVFFRRKDAQGMEHVYAVFQNKKLRLNAHELTVAADSPGRLTIDQIKTLTRTPVSGGGPGTGTAAASRKGLSKTTIGLLGGGALVGALIIANGGDDQPASK